MDLNGNIKAPDSVYLSELLLSSMTLRDYDENRIQYIRKDALMEWAKERYKHYQQHAEDAVCWGQRNAFQQLIDKLNSI